MMRTCYKIAYPTIFTFAVLLAACSDNESDSDGNATVPANAITISDSNAESTLSAAVTNRGYLEAFSSDSFSIRDAIAVINEARETLVQLPKSAIAAVTETACTSGGTASYSFSESGNTKTGSLTFSACIVGTSHLSLSGGWTYTETINPETSVYDKSFTGSVTMTDTVNNVTISLNNLDFAETGNKDAGTFTTTKFTLSLNFTISGISALGYLVELTAPIVESTGDLCPESGSIRVTGANSTYAEIVYNGDGTYDISANGTLVNNDVSCVT